MRDGRRGRGAVGTGLFTRSFVVVVVVVFHFTTVLSHWGSSHGENRVAFPGESQLRQSRATQTRVHAGSVSASIFHPALTRTTGSLTCAQILMHTIAHGVVGRPQQSALKVKGHWGEKSLAAPVNRTCVNSVPVRCSTNWTISLPCYLLSLSGKIEWS